MPGIENYVEQIRKATYGRDVREAIASGIEECYSDVTQAKTIADDSIEAAEAKAQEAASSAAAAATASQDAITAKDTAVQKAGEASQSATAAAQSASEASAVRDSIPVDYTSLSNSVDDLKSALSIPYINLFDKSAVLDGKYVTGDGNVDDGPLYYLTDYIPVNGAVRIQFTALDSPQINTVIVRYNSNKVFQDRLVSSAGADFVLAYNGYIRINCLKSNVDPDSLIITAGYGKPDYSNYNVANDVEARDKVDALTESIYHVDGFAFKIGNYTVTLGFVPTYNAATLSRFCIDGFILIRAGETISTKWSNVEFLMIFCDKNGIALQADGTYQQTYTATEDCYAYIVFKSDSISDYSAGNWLGAHSYYFHKYRASDSIWKGKTWYSFGTSMSDINTDGTTGNNLANGRWPLIVDELGGMTRTNKAIGGGGIVPSADHHGNVKANIMQCPYDVDLVTFECGLNDWGTITLGDLGDKSDSTFIGNFTQCIEYLTYHTRAKLVFISMVPLTLTNYDTGERRDVFFENSFGYTYRDYVNAMIEVCQYYGVEVIDASANALSNGRLNKDTLKDTTHFNWLGGMICGRYIWSKLKDILPLPKFPNNR